MKAPRGRKNGTPHEDRTQATHAPALPGAFRERISANLRRGVLEFCVLALLADRDRYGLELTDELVDRGLTAGGGTLYPLLARMRKAGTVETRWDASHEGSRSRRYYSITADGRSQLAEFRLAWADTVRSVDAVLRTTDAPAAAQPRTPAAPQPPAPMTSPPATGSAAPPHRPTSAAPSHSPARTHT